MIHQIASVPATERRLDPTLAKARHIQARLKKLAADAHPQTGILREIGSGTSDVVSVLHWIE